MWTLCSRCTSNAKKVQEAEKNEILSKIYIYFLHRCCKEAMDIKKKYIACDLPL